MNICVYRPLKKMHLGARTNHETATELLSLYETEAGPSVYHPVAWEP